MPWPKQQSFLDCDNLEAMYGGAAGGGKSDALLRAALQFVHVPFYSALILRTDFQRLSLSGGLIPRSHQWLTGKGAKWNGGNFRWHFPNGATIQFGYLAKSTDKYRYGSSEYQFIAFDELTEFAEDDYTFMFSRLRKTINIDVPYRIRSATNPGGRGHEWVMARFITKQAQEDLVRGSDAMQMKYEHDGRIFVPARVQENPAVDPVAYIKNLMHLNPVERERLMNGDWNIMPTGLCRPAWLRYYSQASGNYIVLLKSATDAEGYTIHTIDEVMRFPETDCVRFMTVDAAGGVEDVQNEVKGKKLSNTACGVWDCKSLPGGVRILVLRHVELGRGLNYVDMRDLVCKVHKQWIKPRGGNTYIENKAMGMALVADMQSRSLSAQAISKGTVDKIAHASPFLNLMERGHVYLPKEDNSWCPKFIGELLRWRGLDNEMNDQVDISSYAAQIAGGFFGGVVHAIVDPRTPTTELGRNPLNIGGGGFMSGWQ